MSVRRKRKYLKGILSLGLALMFSDNCIADSVTEERRSEERILSLSIEKNHLPTIAMITGRRLRQHVDSATCCSASGDIAAVKTHLKVARELLYASQMLMPYMGLFDLLQETRQDIRQGDRYLFHYNQLAISREVSGLQVYFPKIAGDIKKKLGEVYALAESTDDAVLANELNGIISTLSQEINYLPILAVQLGVLRAEKEVENDRPDNNKLRNILELTSQVLASSDRNYWTPFESRQVV